MGNKGAYIHLRGSDLKPEFHQFTAVVSLLFFLSIVFSPLRLVCSQNIKSITVPFDVKGLLKFDIMYVFLPFYSLIQMSSPWHMPTR